MWNGLTHLRVFDVALSPNYSFDGTLLAYADRMRLDGWQEGHSVFRSTDRGLHWTLVFSDTEESWFRDELPLPEELLPPAPSLPAVWFRRRLLGLERTTDGGQTWEEITIFSRPEGYFVELLPSPGLASDGTVYVLYDYGLGRSADGGDTWERCVDSWLEGLDYGSRITAGAITPILPDGGHRLLVGTARGEFRSLDPAVLAWESE
jgi:hypothetical protein